MKLAVIFPGIGYHVDKPLLFYARKLAEECGFEIKNVPYGNFPAGVKGDAKKMEQAFYSALMQAEEILKNVDFKAYDTLLFISKSVGTAVAAAYADRYKLHACNLFYTPVDATFPLIKQEGVVFHGTKDSWAHTETVETECREKGLKLYLTENADHSLETGDVIKDLEILKMIMEQSRAYMENL